MILRKAKRFDLLHLRGIEMHPYESPPPSLRCYGSGGGGLVAKDTQAGELCRAIVARYK